MGLAGPLQLHLELFDELVEGHRALVKRRGFQDVAELTSSVRRQEVCKIEVPGSPFRGDREHADQIQTEVCKVRQRFLTERLIVQLCSDQPQAAQGSGTGAEFGHRRRRQGQLRSHNDFLHLSPPGQQDSDRAAKILRELAHGFGQLRGEDFVVRHTASVQSLYGRELTGPQSDGLTKNFRNGLPPFL